MARGREIVWSLPSTVERATPDVFADQTRWVSRSPEPPRGTWHCPCTRTEPRHGRGEQLKLALAERIRIEGCLLGQGRRTGNVDLLAPGPEPVQPGVSIELTSRTWMLSAAR